MRLVFVFASIWLVALTTWATPPSLDAVLKHTRAFYDIAMINGGNRASTTPGHELSAAYIEEKLHDSSFTISRQYFRGTFNLIAESKSGDPRHTVVFGAHLDSVPTGPGINDNAATAAVLLEIALGMKEAQPKNKVRFIWWGGEEWGLVGSSYYVHMLSETEKADIAFYLNFDMIASPNYLLGVYTGTDYQRGSRGERDSNALAAAFHREFRRNNSKSVGFLIGNRGDHAEFAMAGIPTAGLCTGADGYKSWRAAQMFGGHARKLFDPCYHLACDDMNNLNLKALKINSAVMAGMVERFGASLEGLSLQ